jgi:hypothetical protein
VADPKSLELSVGTGGTKVFGWTATMKRTLLALMIAIFGAVALDRVPGHEPAAYAMSVADDKKGKKGDKKDPPGPPVVRPKEPKEPPKKDKRP